jgi:hypothetical protein
MASLYLMKNSVRNQALCLFQHRTAVPLNISKLISKMICLPINYQFQNLKNLNVSGKTVLNLLGKPVLRKLSLDEQSIVENILLQQTKHEIGDKDREKIVKKIENNACAFYRRLEFKSPCNSIFTTAAYVRSKKRINYCALLEDGRFFLMESFVYVDEAIENFKVFIFGRSMGHEFRQIFSPWLMGKQFASFPGQTAKLAGLGDLEAISPHQVSKKCVVAAFNSLLSSFIVTALTNTVESD